MKRQELSQPLATYAMKFVAIVGLSNGILKKIFNHRRDHCGLIYAEERLDIPGQIT